MNITRLQHLLLHLLLVWVSSCLAVCVKCDLGMFLNACWAVKRTCHYYFRFPLFSPLLHWYLLPATPAITCSPQVLLAITLTSRVTCWDICNQFSCILDLIKVRKATVFRKQKTLFWKSCFTRMTLVCFNIFSLTQVNNCICFSILAKKRAEDFRWLVFVFGISGLQMDFL